jgi:hypothetical protein
MAIKFSPRNDFVLVRIVDKGFVGNLAVPGRSAQGKQYFIVAKGPDVKDLKVDDQVLCIGQVGQDVILLPDHNDLLVTKQNNVILVVTEEVEETIDLSDSAKECL